MTAQIAIIIPTYNAKNSIVRTISGVLIKVKKSIVIVVDDNSPDGTAKIIRKYFYKNKRVKLMVRESKNGRGSAVIYGFKEGLKNKNIKFFIEMDADFSHDPKYIPQLIKVCRSKDVAVASKYLKESNIIDLPLYRKLISQVANICLKLILGLPISDYTNGFRCYTRKVIKTIDLDSIQAKGFSALTEIAYIIHKNKFSFGEIPVSVKYYQATGSNFNIHEVEEGLLTVFRLLKNKFFVFSLPRVLWRFIHNNKEILFLLFLTLIFFHKIILHPHNMIYPAGDIVAQYSFEKKFLADYIFQYKQLPLWNPYIYGGVSFLANPAVAMFYPTNIFFLLFPSDIVFGYLFALDVFLLGIFTYNYAKTIHLDSFSSLIASVIIMFNGSIIGKTQLGHLYIIDTIIWFPLLLLLYEKYLQTKKIIFGIFASIPITLMFLAGNIQIAEYNIIAALFYIIFRYIFNGKNKKIAQIIKLCAFLAISFILGLSLAAVQLLPLVEFSQASPRAGGLPYDFASDFSLHPYQILSFILPHFFGSYESYWGLNGSFWELNGYAGILPIILSLMSYIHKKKVFIIIFSLIAIFSILFAAGRFGFLFLFLYKHIPTFNFFRVPARIIYLYIFSISILSGFGISILQQKKESKLLKIQSSIGLLIIVSIIFVPIFYIQKSAAINFLLKKGYAINNNLSDIYSFILIDLIIFTVFLICSYILFYIRITKKLNLTYIKLLILIIIVSDLWVFGIKFINIKNPKEVFKQQPILQYIQKDKSRYRVLDLSGAFISDTPRNSIETTSGYGSLYTKYYRDFIWLTGDHAITPFEGFFTFYDIQNKNILKLLNTKYILTNKELHLTDLEKIYSNTSFIYQLKDPLPRAYIVPNAVILNDRSKILDVLKDPSYDPKKYVILEKKQTHPINNTSSYKEVKILQYEPNTIRLETTLPNPGFLVLSEVWYPGWKAYDNGKEMYILRANYTLRSIYLNGGKHTITFMYDPLSYKIGKLISLTSFLVSVLAMGYLLGRNKNLYYLKFWQRKNKMPTIL